MDAFFKYFFPTKKKSEPAPFLPEIFIEAAKTGDSVTLQSLFDIHKEIPINKTFEWKNLKHLNAFQIVCSEIHERIDFLEFEPKRRGYIECCRILLNNGIDVQYRDPMHKSEAIDYALLTGIKEIGEMTLEVYKKLEISIVHKGLLSSVLNFYFDSQELDREHLEILELLINEGVDVNMFDYEWAQPPIYLAAKLKFKSVIELFCRKKVYEIDFDFFLDSRGRTARYLICKWNLYEGVLPKKFALSDFLIYKTLFEHDTAQFIIEYKSSKREMSNEKKISFLFRALNSGNEEIFEYLLRDIQWNFTDNEILLSIASTRGFYKIVNILVEEYGETDYDLEFLKRIITIHRKPSIHEKRWVNYNKCLEILVHHSILNLNKVERSEETILEVAINNKQYMMILILLNSGASLLKYDAAGTDIKCFLGDIEPKILEEHFNNCLHSTKVIDNLPKRKRLIISRDVAKIDYYVDFISILPPRQKIELFERSKKTYEDSDHTYSEMKVVEQISQNSEYMYLLNHPFIALFISLKWRKVRMLYYTHLFIYVTYTIVLNLFIIKESLALYIILTVLFIVLTLWNTIHILVFKTKYFGEIENCVKVFVGVCSAGILSMYFLNRTESLLFIKRQVEGITALVSITNIFFLAQYFSGFSVYVIIIKNIYNIMFTAFCQYCFLFIGFGTSFFILFHNTYERFFGHFLMSILKTILMTTKNYDSDLLGLANNFPNIRHLIMLLFVLLVCLGLLNLLIGLAVNDIDDIKSNAELYSEIFKIKSICLVEEIFLKRDIPKWLKFSKNICLFPIHEEKTTIEIYTKPAVAFFTANTDRPMRINSKCMMVIDEINKAKAFKRMQLKG